MKNKHDIPWWLIISMLVFFWPVGMVLMFLKLFGDENKGKINYNKKGYKLGEEVIDVPFRSSDDPVGAKLKPEKKRSKLFSLSKGKWLRGLGIGLTFAGALSSAIAFIANMLSYSYLTESLLISSLVFLCIGAPGLALTFWGQRTITKAQRYSRYARLIGENGEVSLDRVAGAMGVDFEKVCDDLQYMLDAGFFEGYYVDIERRVLTRGRLGSAMPKRSRPEAEAKPKEAESKAVHPADRIHQINETIRQSEVSEKVTRLEILTRRIYNYTETYPEKERLARSFKERYLPKTIKILESYSRFEQSGSSGENVRAAMKDVEAVLDVLTTSFEKQLDMLYMDEALDISTDIDALESMIAGDGLGENPFAAMRQEF